MANPEIETNSILPNNQTLYYQEINRISQLTPEEEMNCGMNIVAGKENPDSPQTVELAQLSRKNLVAANARYARYVAVNYKKLGIPIATEDLIAVANLGLVEASQNYDPRIARFITYADFFIRSRLAEFSQREGSGVKIPKRYRIIFSKIRNLIGEAENQGRILQKEDIADLVSIRPEELDQYLLMLELSQKIDQPIEENPEKPALTLETVFQAKDRLLVQGLKPTANAILIKLGFPTTKENASLVVNLLAQIKRKARQNLFPVSIDGITKPISTDLPDRRNEDESLRDQIPGKTPRPEQVVIDQEMKSRVRQLVQELSQIDSKDARIVELRLGLNGFDEPLTLESIGQVLNPNLPYSHNAVLYRYNKAIQKLREIAPPDLIEYLQTQ